MFIKKLEYFCKQRKIILLFMVFLLIVFCFLKVTQAMYVFTLSPGQVYQYISVASPKCFKLSECHFERGDVLIRRHLTERTQLFENITHSYFTHTAIYIGDGMIAEANGPEQNSDEEVNIKNLSLSDWVADDLEGWVVIRPQAYQEKSLDRAIKEISRIANDPRYVFGVRFDDGDNNQRTSCADLIFRQYSLAGLISDNNTPLNVSPDYLFRYAMTHTDQFGVAGYCLREACGSFR